MKKPNGKKVRARQRRREHKTEKARKRTACGAQCTRYGRKRVSSEERTWTPPDAVAVVLPGIFKRAFSKVRRWTTRRTE